ncbi:MAG: FAD-dependent oxidoreductase [Caldilineaceae bacterium]
MSQPGSSERPLRVAIVGAGPSGFYAAGALLKEAGLSVAIDFFERLVAPHGLVRYGVAPDHQNIKSVSKVYDRTAAEATVRYFGNVEFGKDVTLEDLRRHYDQVIFAVGAQADRRLGIPGEDLPNSLSATEFVAWYNGHPDYADLNPDLSCESVVVVGVGNVAMDVARVLAKTVDELNRTDISDAALEALAASKVRDIYVLSRRGPAQVKFTNAEIREFGHLAAADAIVEERELYIDKTSSKSIEGDTAAQKNIDYLRAYAEIGSRGKPRHVYFRFLISPVEIVAGADGRIAGVRCERNKLVPTDDGDLKAVGTGEFETLPAGMVLRSVGYKGAPLPGVPYNSRAGTITNVDGRVVDTDGKPIPGLYVVGWAKRGPTGVIGTNKPDAMETVNEMIADLATLSPAPEPDPDAIQRLFAQRNERVVSSADWETINAAEVSAGKAQGRPRVKIVAKLDMLKMLEPAAEGAPKLQFAPAPAGPHGDMNVVE